MKTIIDWALFALTLAYMLTGLGVTKYRIVESLTGGLLTKNLSFQIHEILLIPFLISLALHIFWEQVTIIYLRTRKKISKSQ